MLHSEPVFVSTVFIFPPKPPLAYEVHDGAKTSGEDGNEQADSRHRCDSQFLHGLFEGIKSQLGQRFWRTADVCEPNSSREKTWEDF